MAKKTASKTASKASVKSTLIKSSGKLTVSGLSSWNKWLALAFGVQGIAILLFSAVRSFPITVSYLGLDTLQTNAQGKTVLATGSQVLFNVNLAIVVAVFLLVAAIFHGLLATRFKEQYKSGLNQGMNKFRWIEYSLSMSTMIAAIGLIVGVQDLAVLLVIFGLLVISNLVGILVDEQNKDAKNTHWLTFGLSRAAGALPWLLVLIYLISGAIYGSVPAYVYWIAGFAFVLFASVHVNLYLQCRKYGEWKNYLFSERTYMLLSLASKTLIAWLIYAAILRP